MHIFIYGNPFWSGFRLVGPFASEDDAQNYSDKEFSHSDCWVAELDEPAEEFNPSARVYALSEVERDHVLAALRLWQLGSTVIHPEIAAIATCNGSALTNQDIDELCERINR